MNISKHITLKEALHSDIAKKHCIQNIPDCTAYANIVVTANQLFEPLREGLGSKPIYVSSFYRNPQVNALAGGSKTSQHTKGNAMDLDAAYFGHHTNREIFDYIRENLEFDKLIWEFGTDDEPDWVHVSYVEDANRKLVYKSEKINGETK